LTQSIAQLATWQQYGAAWGRSKYKFVYHEKQCRNNSGWVLSVHSPQFCDSFNNDQASNVDTHKSDTLFLYYAVPPLQASRGVDCEARLAW